MNTRPLVLVGAVAAALLPGVALADIPDRPSGLRAEVYSSNSLELFWERDPEVVVYEVFRDGASYASITGSSYFIGGLPEVGTTSRWTVVGIDAGKDRSPEAGITVTLASPAGGASSPSTDPGGSAAPPAPGNLRAVRYSATTAELFWERVPGANLTYTVLRDGASIGTTRGTSFFVDGLPAGAEQRFEVVAFDGSARGASANVTLGASGTGSPSAGTPTAPAPSAPSAGGAPAAPVNARLEVYSDTTAELIWQRAPGSSIARVEVVRDGTVIGTVTGNSFLDGNRVAGRSYTYELIAIGTDGRRSAAATVGGGAPSTGTAGTDVGDGPVFTAENLAAQLPRVFATVNALPQERVEAIGYPFLAVAGGDRAPGDLGLASLGGSRYACASGGTVSLGSVDGTDTATFGACRITAPGGASATLDGQLSRTPRPQGLVDGSGGETVTGRGFTVADASGASVFSGSSSFRNEAGTVLPKRGVIGAHARRSADGASFLNVDSISFTIAELAEERADGTNVVRWDTSATFSADWSGGRTLTASTVQPFANRDGNGGTYTSGVLRVSETKDRSLTIDAGTGDPATFRAVVEADGARSESVLRWSDAFGLRCRITTSGEFVDGSPVERTPYRCR